jgi:hypothetical protein
MADETDWRVITGATWNEPDKHQVGRAGEHFVAAELHRRGAYAVTFAGNMPNIDILASDKAQTRTVSIRVKTRRRGSWHSDIRRGEPLDAAEVNDRFWVFVDLRKPPEGPGFYIVPDRWMRNNIYEAHQEYLARHGGARAVNPASTHHAIKKSRIEQWRDRWDLLGIFGEAAG